MASCDTHTQSVLTLPMRPTWLELIGGSEGGPISQRGWVVQERYLAKRTVYFSPYFLLWRCPSMRAFEDYPNPNAPFETPYLANSGEIFKFWGFSMTTDLGDYFCHPRERETEDLVDIYHSWFKVVKDYSSKKFSKETDRICTIAGLAQRFGELTKDIYLAGLWKRDLVRQLCWSISEFADTYTAQPESYRAPSWSWLTVTYPTFDYTKYITNPASPTLLDTWTSDVQSFVGPVLDGSLKLKGYMTSVKPEPDDVFDLFDPNFGYAKYSSQTSKRLLIQDNTSATEEYIGLLILDVPFWTWNSPGQSFHALKLWQFNVNSAKVLEDDHQSWDCQLLGLGLEVVNENRQEYKRLGLVYIRPHAESWFEDRGNKVEITIK